MGFFARLGLALTFLGCGGVFASRAMIAVANVKSGFFAVPMTTSNPWDAYPFPKSGDDDDKLTYMGVGRVMTYWEGCEFQLSRIYSFFAFDLDGLAIQEYGQERIFQLRISKLQSKADQYFINNSDQELEAGFDEMIQSCAGYSERRNEVAHGFVFPVTELTLFRERFFTNNTKQFALIPPYYSIRKHDERGLPKYAYTSVELADLSQKLQSLIYALGGYRELLLATHCIKNSSRKATR